MSNAVISVYRHPPTEQRPRQIGMWEQGTQDGDASASLAAAITKEASSQTYLTIRYLVDPPLVDHAYRAYAYFRWVDDILDQDMLKLEERITFLVRQREIVKGCYRDSGRLWMVNQHRLDLCPEERMVVDLIASDPSPTSGLAIYIHEMMNVMAIDVERRGRFISQAELDEYTRSLATAVTEALHYFIGHNQDSPHDETRYLAVTGAHITHMLRDLIEDTETGYYNIPQSFLEENGVNPDDVYDDAFRTWVISRVEQARANFAAGRQYMSRVENLRCRLAGYAYIARFEVVLDAIEKDGYRLRAAYPERKSTGAKLKMIGAALTQTAASILDDRPKPGVNPDPVMELI